MGRSPGFLAPVLIATAPKSNSFPLVHFAAFDHKDLSFTPDLMIGALFSPYPSKIMLTLLTDIASSQARLRLFLLKLIFCALFLSACSTPPPATKAPLDPLQPWMPTRKGEFPADLACAADLPQKKIARSPSSLAQGPLHATAFIAWRLYSHTLSRTMGDTCRFGPTCSRFALDSMALGPGALFVTFARLQRNQLDDDFYALTADGFLIDRPWDYVFWRSNLGLNAHTFDIPPGQAWTIFLKAAADLPEDYFAH